MDVLHDNSHRTWLQLGEKLGSAIPSYVMEYSLPDKEAASEIDSELFADPVRKLFPVSDQSMTWLSAAYYEKHAQAGDLPYKKDEAALVLETIKRAAKIYGISEDVDAVLGELAGQAEKQAADESSNYGWIMRDATTGQVLARKYPMFDARGVKKASAYFDEYRARYPIGIRRSIARNIIRKAAEYGIANDELDAGVLKEAGYGIPRKDRLMEEIYERAHLTKDAEQAIALANINELVVGMPDSEIAENLDKLAEVIDAFDNAAGLTCHYGKKILMPSDFLFDVSIKEASTAVEDAVELKRHVFSISKLAELPLSVYGDVLGDEFAKSVVKSGSEDPTVDPEKLADNLYSLPVPDKAALEEHLIALFR